MLRQPRYNDPRYAVSRPPMVTAAHNRQAAETNLRPREETAPFASQAAASRFKVLWKYHITPMAIITSVNFTSNIPSARYCAGFVIHSVKPLMTWSTTAIQTRGTSLFNEVYGIVRNNPSRRRPMMDMRPTTVAVPNAWIVSASGQPHDSLTHIAYGVCASHSSTFSLPDRYEVPIRACRNTGRNFKSAALAGTLVHGLVQVIRSDEGEAQDA